MVNRAIHKVDGISHHNCWAKTNDSDEPGLTPYEHCLNVGLVAEQLAKARPISNIPRPWVRLLAAWHDIGKVSPGFQVKCSKWLTKQGLETQAIEERWGDLERNHGRVSQYTINNMLKCSAFPSKLRRRVSQLIGGHHGRLFSDRLVDSPGMSNDEWERQRQTLASELKQALALGEDDGIFEADEDWLYVLAGLVSVADWVGSDERFFSTEGGRDIEDATKDASRAVTTLGLVRDLPRVPKDFEELFPFPPNALQEAAMREIVEPGVYVIEAPMGMGKTEAALATAQRLVAEGKADGIYFALPTQATSNRIHLRMASFCENAFGEGADVRLVHASSWLADELPFPQPSNSGSTEGLEGESFDARVARRWFGSSRRALLSSFGVGTVDQCLLGVIAAKHFFVRRYGLARKVVIIDEIHSYDVYTGLLIDKLVQAVTATGGTALILSATLTTERRLQLLEANEENPETTEREETGFPLISGRRTEDNVYIASRSVEPPPDKKVGIRFASRPDATTEAIDLASGGACVLWICNTVASAQETFRSLQLLRAEGQTEIGLLHSRFPFFRREELEEHWMSALGKDGSHRPNGCILVSTQIVEQSVDLDADLLVTELAPTDMLLQRMGRLWRHPRNARTLNSPQTLIIKEDASLERLLEADANEIREVFGPKGKVYEPYILLRTLRLWAERQSLSLPGDIRGILNDTYAEDQHAPPAWGELLASLVEKRKRYRSKAIVASNPTGILQTEDREGIATRISEMETIPILLTREYDDESIVLADGSEMLLPNGEFDYPLAKALHRNLVKVPAYAFDLANCPPQPHWLRRHVFEVALPALMHDGEFPLQTPCLNEVFELQYQEDVGIEIIRIGGGM
jgi:CRISPR-associated endonuclease/helicase Cas3